MSQPTTHNTADWRRSILIVGLCWFSGCLEPAETTVPTSPAVTAETVSTVAPTPRKLFLDAAPTCVDPGQFLPVALQRVTPDEPLTVTLQSLPGFLRGRFDQPTMLDTTRLEEFGVELDKPSIFPSRLPLYLALEQWLGAEDLDWLWRQGVLVVTTAEFANQELVSQQYNVAKLLRRMHGDVLFSAIENCTGSEDDGPWLSVHGGGGTLTLAGHVLAVRQTQRVQREVACLLQALEHPQPYIFVDRPAEDLRLLAALRDIQVPVQFYETELQAAMDYFGQTAGVATRLDSLRLAEFGVGHDLPLTVELPSRPLGQNLELLLSPLELAAIPLDGALTVTTAEYANNRLDIVLFDVSDIAPDLVSVDQLVVMIQDQTGDEEYGPWLDVHGVGGTIATPTDRLLIVRQTYRTLGEVHELLNSLRKDFASRPLPPYADPQAFETRYYRLPRATAQDLQRLLPQRVAAGTWNTPVQLASDRGKGTAEIVEVGQFWRQYSPAGLYGDGGAPGANGQTRDPYRDFDAVLVVRQRVAVQKRIKIWVNQLLFGDQSGQYEPLTVPSGRLPE